jgi:hypothetical protein
MECWARTNWPTGCAERLVVPITTISPFHRRSLDHALQWFVDIGEEAQLRLGRACFGIEWKHIYGAERAYFDRS